MDLQNAEGSGSRKRRLSVKSLQNPSEQLINAVKDDDQGGVLRALQDGASPDTCMEWSFPDEWGGSYKEVPVLTVAAVKGYAQVVAILLEGKANANFRGDFQLVPISSAIVWGHVNIVRKMLCYEADVNKRNFKTGALPIHYAASMGLEKVAKLLQDHGSSLDVTDDFGRTPFHEAALKGKRPMLEWLIQKGINVAAVDDNDKNAADLAESAGHTEEALWLRSIDPVPIAPVVQPTTREPGTENQLSLLSSREQGPLALHSTRTISNTEDAIASVYNKRHHATNLSRLCAATLVGDPLIVSGAILRGESADTLMPFEFPGTTWDVKEGIYSSVPLLTTAASKGYDEVIKVLLDAHANTELMGDFCIPPLSAAIIPGHTAIVTKLLENGASVDACNSITGTYPIHYAAGIGRLSIAQLLQKHGSRLEPINKDLCTPMHYAAIFGNTSIVEWLDHHGVSLSLVNDNGRTAVEEAESHGHDELAAWLRNRIREGMYKNDKGRIIFFNYVRFDQKSCSNRTGAEEDSTAIIKLFESYGEKYEVFTYDSLTSDQTLEKLRYHQNNVSLSEVDSITIFISSHGFARHQFCTRDGSLDMVDVRSFFHESNSGCIHLIGKGKIFIANYCQGFGREGRHRPIAEASCPREYGDQVPRNMITFYSTSEGYVSWRKMDGGSYLIQNFCQLLRKHPNLEIQQLIFRVNKEVEKETELKTTYSLEGSRFNHFYI